jgi:hypothetical protein
MDAAEQFRKARVGAQVIEIGLYLKPNQPIGALGAGSFQPGEALVHLAQTQMDNRYEVWRHVPLF